MLPMVRGVLIDAGVDWITATCKPGEGVEKLECTALSLAEVEMSLGFYGRPWSGSGYEGFSVGSVTYGTRPDGAVLRLGGVVAQAHFGRVVTIASNVTRIDLQATFRVEGEVGVALTTHYREMRAHAKQFKRAPGVAIFIGRDYSRTIYSGSRQSDRYGRIYDKGAESKLKQFEGSVRYEQEIKGVRSARVASGIVAGMVNRESIATECLRFFAARGCRTRSLLVPTTDSITIVNATVSRRRSDTDRSLAWLDKAVRPSVKRLVAMGYSGLVLRSLGLPESTQLPGGPYRPELDQTVGGNHHGIGESDNQ